MSLLFESMGEESGIPQELSQIVAARFESLDEASITQEFPIRMCS